MSKLLNKFEAEQITKLTENKTIPEFQAGDTIRVNVRIIEGTTERIQGFEGVCIARKNRGINSAFTVRKISHGEGVERVFPLYSPRIESIQVVRRGDVRRAKLYYMRGLTGKAARIKEKRDWESAKEQKTAAPKKAEKTAPAKKAEEKKTAPAAKEEAKAKTEAKAEAKQSAPEAKKEEKNDSKE